jgi:hypothetical protein
MMDIDSDNDFDDLLDDFPSLKSVAPFVALASDVRWFRSLGDAPDSEAKRLARDYGAALGFPDAEPAFINNWEDAADAAENTEINSPAWEAEEQLRASLTNEVLLALDPDTLEMVMNHIAQSVTTAIDEAAREAAEFLRIDDEAFVLAISGAAAQACYQAGLVGMAGEEEDHPLSIRFQLFERGHWPIGILGNSFLIF